MPQTSLHPCQCPHGQGDTPHPDQALHRQMHVSLSRLDAPQRRGYAALAARRLGHGGDPHVARITGLDVHTIRRAARRCRVTWVSAPPPAVPPLALAARGWNKRPPDRTGLARLGGARNSGGSDGEQK